MHANSASTTGHSKPCFRLFRIKFYQEFLIYTCKPPALVCFPAHKHRIFLGLKQIILENPPFFFYNFSPGLYSVAFFQANSLTQSLLCCKPVLQSCYLPCFLLSGSWYLAPSIRAGSQGFSSQHSWPVLHDFQMSGPSEHPPLCQLVPLVDQDLQTQGVFQLLERDLI